MFLIIAVQNGLDESTQVGVYMKVKPEELRDATADELYERYVMDGLIQLRKELGSR